MKDKDIKHLEWVYERMKFVHNENENYDYMIRFREILEALRQPAVSGMFCEKCDPNGVVDGNVVRCKKCGRGLALIEQNYH